MKVSLLKNPTKVCAALSCLTVAAVTASPAYAVDYPVSVGVSQRLTLMAADRVLVDLDEDRSYACEAIPENTVTTNFDFDETIISLGATTDTVTARLGGDIVPKIGAEAGGSADNRLIFTAGQTDRYALEVAGTSTGGETVAVRCFDTTLFGGFNTFVNDFNFLELQNIGNATINARVTAVTFNGTVVVNEQPVSIPAGQRFDLSIHDAAGPDVYGVLRVTHDAPLGTLVGVNSQYFGTVESFSLGASQKLEPLTQKP